VAEAVQALEQVERVDTAAYLVIQAGEAEMLDRKVGRVAVVVVVALRQSRKTALL
jgi:hypothetical protein